MKKVAELEGAELDYWVARALDLSPTLCSLDTMPPHFYVVCDGKYNGPSFAPSTDWSQGGPIIECEGIVLWKNQDQWQAIHPSDSGGGFYDPDTGTLDVNCNDGLYGSTPLIAAMRCFVASKFGDTVS